MNKNLVILTDNYPISSGEFFIDDEMRVIANKFEKVIIITENQYNSNLNRYVSDNMQISIFQNNISLENKLKVVLFFFKPFFLKELIFIIKTIEFKFWFASFKVMVIDLMKAINLKSQILEIKKNHNLNYSNTIFYSYWHDYKALSLALLKNENKKIKCISRAHGWDVFYDRHNPPYLPFKKFIVSNLNQTYSISDAGKSEFENNIRCKLENKVKVSRLGKLNLRDPKKDKDKNDITICSCSNLISLKRINLIIDILSKLPFKNIRWVHFGDGFLRYELEQYAKTKISHINYEFKGNVNNSEILDFYSQNYIDLFINVSESEGIPVSIMEALSAGIPVIATNVGGTSEAVNENFGFLLEKYFKIEKAVEIINSFLNLPNKTKETYRLNAYNFWRENYNGEKNYTDFVNEILNL